MSEDEPGDEPERRRMVWIDPLRRDSERMRQVADTLQAQGDAARAAIAVDPDLLGSLLLAVHHDQSYRRASTLWDDAVALTDAMAEELGSALPPLPASSVAVHIVEQDDHPWTAHEPPDTPEELEGE